MTKLNKTQIAKAQAFAATKPPENSVMLDRWRHRVFAYVDKLSIPRRRIFLAIVGEA